MTTEYNRNVTTLICDRDVDGAKSLIHLISDALDDRGYAVHHWAAYCDESMILLDIIQHHPCFIQTRTKDDNTILHVAAQNSSLRAVDAIISYFKTQEGSYDAMSMYADKRTTLSFYLELHNRWGETCLHLAASSGNITMVSRLLEIGASKSSKDQWNRRAYDIARQCGHSSELIALLHDSDSNEDPSCNDDAIKCLPEEYSVALQKAMSEEFMKSLSNRVSKYDSMTMPVVKNIFATASTESTDSLPSTDTNAAPAIIISTNRIALSKRIEYPGNIIDIQSMLLNPVEFDPAGRDMYGLAAIHKFASWNQVECLELLLPLLANDTVNAVNNTHGFTALHYCVEDHADRALEYLLHDERIDQSIKDKKGRSPLDLAVELGASRAIQLLS